MVERLSVHPPFQPSPSPRFEHPTAVHFGAGSIGLGFIGVLLAKAGYHVIFADINPKVISRLNIDTTYTISYLGPRRPRPFHVHNISGVLSNDKAGIMTLAEDIADREMKIITTSIGFGALKQIAPIVARGITLRKEEHSGSLNVIACENGKGASDLLKVEVYKDLDEDTRAWADLHVGFANCSVDRIVPSPVHEQEEMLSVGVDKFFEWIVDINGLKSVNRSRPTLTLDPPIPGMILTETLPAYQDRKLYVFNCGHAITAYLGTIFRRKVISEAIADKNILTIVKGAMEESGSALVKEYPEAFHKHDIESYINKTIGRYQNPNVVDDVTRVGRQPLRKLGHEERLLGPFHLAKKHGLPTKYLATGIAAALMYRNDDDEQAIELKNTEEADGVEGAIQKIFGIKHGAGDFEEILDAYNTLADQRKEFISKEKN
ncbi:mannitol-1-phosphate 5-dehydrogenase [Macrolepiota fuliginosa MF-IS2]|uniref:Mannitol-1-phosphate 5-dehydrogenase n=1 Tax=Macrolepiota fuliginosa MF-IS2 TaxID=1400762 RepID=A0A9P5XPT8_9AGAR|nr:mannitol-1-phosphate 5-dehydrogenase [Macrolepiota fuliginosa MF-IS2]